ncbi:MAG: hypothetical protein PF795_14365, partial [Kiritimatiellae bacterium]|nr:hypothetical protein [Kiritimatiellia bacterium]
PEALDARFEIRYTITIRKSGDMLVGLQSPDSSGSNWGDSSFQMNASNGHFRVRDGNTYRTVTEVPYEENKAYRFRVVADVAEKTYSVWVRPDDETEEILLARDFRARDGNNTFTHLNKLIYSGREGADITNIELLTLGRSLSGEKVKLSFQEPGQHEVQLTVRDAHGATDSKILSIEVK